MSSGGGAASLPPKELDGAPGGRADGCFAELTAAVLLGGGSTRMGRDKAWLELGGEPLATRLARRLLPLCAEVLLVGGRPPPSAPGRRVADPPGPRCALRGLVAALGAAETARVLVVATDLPFLGEELVLALAARPPAEVVVPEREGKLHPTCAIYRREGVLERARRHLEEGRLRLRGLLAELEVDVLPEPELRRVDPSGRMLRNVNTPEAWREIQGLHASGERVDGG